MSGLIGWVILLVISSLITENVYRKSVKNNSPRQLISEEATNYEKTFSDLKHKEYQKNRILGHLAPVLIIGNHLTDLVPGWILLPAISLLIIQAFYRDSKLRLDRNYWYSKLPDGRPDANHQLKEREIDKNRLIAILVVIALSVYWVYQIDKNLKADQREYSNELLDLVGNSGWCENNEAERDGAGGFYTYGGWPCIFIASANNVRFFEENKKELACAYIGLNREVGYPGEESFQNSYKVEQYCVERDPYYGYSISELESSIYNSIKGELRQLNVDLCRRYGYSLSEESRSNFCYGVN